MKEYLILLEKTGQKGGDLYLKNMVFYTLSILKCYLNGEMITFPQKFSKYWVSSNKIICSALQRTQNIFKIKDEYFLNLPDPSSTFGILHQGNF